MPIYEYTCDDCGRLTSVFTRSMSANVNATCTHCGSAKLTRALSRFAYNQTEQQVLERHGAEPQRLLAAAEAYDQQHPGLPPGRRIDLIAIDLDTEGGLVSLQHIESAVEEG